MQSNPNGGKPDPAKLEVHPAADLFPLIEGAEFQELVYDIRTNGLRTPILLDPDGRVLDGRNRLRACRAAGVEPRFETWDGRGSPFELVVSFNLRRRHLNESQRAILGAQIKERMAQEGRANWRGAKALENAALLMNISPRSIQRAERLLHSGDQNMICLVVKGELPVSAAVEKLRQKSEPAANPAGERFPILHAAPRWERQKFERLAAHKVSELAAEDAVLFLSTPDHALAAAMELIGCWGFRYEASIVLPRKPRSGRYTRPQHEQVLIALRGRGPAPDNIPYSLTGEGVALEHLIDKMFPGLPRADALRA